MCMCVCVCVCVCVYIYIYIKHAVLLTQYCADCKIEKNEMGGVCGAYGGGEGCVQDSGGET